jgi:polysaccharide pyruvyl transferase WcaK-like protein
MRIHHFAPRTPNLGDHFVCLGIEHLFRTLLARVEFVSLNVNGRGDDPNEFGLTARSIARANREADLVVVGGSNLYEPHPRTGRWGVYLEPGALCDLRVPLFLVGIGTGSDFGARTPTRPSRRVAEEIRRLNACATFSGVRDVVTLAWLRGLGVERAELMGDPATFLFTHPYSPRPVSRIAVVMPPRRFFWHRWERIRFWDMRGPNLMRALIRVADSLLRDGYDVTVLCNDPRDPGLAQALLPAPLRQRLHLPATADEYIRVLAGVDAVVTGRLHTAILAFSLGIPFVLLDADQRTHGFVRTYGLGDWAVLCAWVGIEGQLRRAVGRLLSGHHHADWVEFMARRDRMRAQALALLREALRAAFGPERAASGVR